jgi:hypothetical protein
MFKKSLKTMPIIMIAIALTGLIIIVLNSSDIIRIIAAAIAVTSCIIVGIVCYVLKRDDSNGK